MSSFSDRHVERDLPQPHREHHFKSASDVVPWLKLDSSVLDLPQGHGAGTHAGEQDFSQAFHSKGGLLGCEQDTIPTHQLNARDREIARRSTNTPFGTLSMGWITPEAQVRWTPLLLQGGRGGAANLRAYGHFARRIYNCSNASVLSFCVTTC